MADDLQREIYDRLYELSGDIKAIRERFERMASREWVHEQLTPMRDTLIRSTAALEKVESLFVAHEAKLQASAMREQDQFKEGTFSAKLKRFAPYIGIIIILLGVLGWAGKVIIEKAVNDAVRTVPKVEQK